MVQRARSCIAEVSLIRVALVRESWQRFEPAVRGAGVHVYDRLFELDPGARRLFAATDMSVQEAKQMQIQMFGDIVRSLDQPA